MTILSVSLNTLLQNTQQSAHLKKILIVRNNWQWLIFLVSLIPVNIYLYISPVMIFSVQKLWFVHLMKAFTIYQIKSFNHFIFPWFNFPRESKDCIDLWFHFPRHERWGQQQYKKQQQ